MKKILLISATLMLAHAAFSQGTVTFANRGNTTGSTASAPGAVSAAIYGVDPNDPTGGQRRVSGNTSAGIPMGSSSYAGIPFLTTIDPAHSFTATLWGLNSAQVTGVGAMGANNLVPLASTTFRTNVTSGAFAGIFNQPSTPAVVPGVVTDTDRATFQVRVWDTRGGQIATWDQALSTPGEVYGWSDLLALPYALGGTAIPQNPPPYLQGLQSFNMQVVVPEPSVIALGVLGAGCLFLLRRRK
jgi:hypothetical protein